MQMISMGEHDRTLSMLSWYLLTVYSNNAAVEQSPPHQLVESLRADKSEAFSSLTRNNLLWRWHRSCDLLHIHLKLLHRMFPQFSAVTFKAETKTVWVVITDVMAKFCTGSRRSKTWQNNSSLSLFPASLMCCSRNQKAFSKIYIYINTVT